MVKIFYFKICFFRYLGIYIKIKIYEFCIKPIPKETNN